MYGLEGDKIAILRHPRCKRARYIAYIVMRNQATMAGDRYFIRDQHQTYFITCTVVEWIDIFTRSHYKHIITDSLNYCIKAKGLKVNGWVLMTNHLHLLVRCEEPHRMSDFLRDFKKVYSNHPRLLLSLIVRV